MMMQEKNCLMKKETLPYFVENAFLAWFYNVLTLINFWVDFHLDFLDNSKLC